MDLIVDFDKTIVLSFEHVPSGRDVKRAISAREGWPCDMLHLSCDGKQIQDGNEINPDSIFVKATVKGGLKGGKGGFGAMLRRLAKQSGKKKTTDFGACRDLSGRRIRHINDEIILEKWRDAKDRGEEFNVDQETPSGINLWFLPTPSWSEGFGKKYKAKMIKPRRKTKLCSDWLRARKHSDGSAREAPPGAPAWWGCPRGPRCEWAHGEEELQGEELEKMHQKRKQESMAAETKKRDAYMGVLDTHYEEDEGAFQDLVASGLKAKAAKRAKTDNGSEDKDVSASSGGGVAEDYPDAGISDETAPGTHGEVPAWLTVLSGQALVSSETVGEVDGDQGFSTLCVECSMSMGHWYYEVELLSGGLMQIGWINESFRESLRTGVIAADDGVGDDTNSWAYDGLRKQRWHGQYAVYGDKYISDADVVTDDGKDRERAPFSWEPIASTWQAGDVVGCFLSISRAADGSTERRFAYSLNGKYLGEAFCDMTKAPKPGSTLSAIGDSLNALSPGISMDEGEAFVINIGQKEFKHTPQSVEHHALLDSVVGNSDSRAAEAENVVKMTTYKPIMEAVNSAASKYSNDSDVLTASEEQAKSSVGPSANAQKVADTVTYDPIDLESDAFSAGVAALEALGLGHLKAELERRGLKAGGTLAERAGRLLSVRGVPYEKIDRKLKAKK